ncbi:MAG: DUF1730 domain-containing protein [Oscillospiraceae bacterium]|jgi:epoxyqueuosine reductase QueG|nr:DUF1730 domain-containing protein [Oscillospiraceae bacterium]
MQVPLELLETLPLWGVIPYPAAITLLDTQNAGLIPKEPKSIIVAAFPYLLPEERYGKNRNISRYACVPDYHKVVSARLREVCEKLRAAYPTAQMARFCDNSPFPEVALAVEAGLGVRGRHGLLITKAYGSWVFIGEIVTDIPFEPMRLTPQPHPCTDCFGHCRSRCPGEALDSGKLRRDLCLSMILQRRIPLPAKAADMVKQSGCIWGCDTCQEVCPANWDVRINPLPEFAEDIQPILTEQTMDLPNRAYTWRGHSILVRNLGLWKPDEERYPTK